ncbi:unnamed protein product [Arctogadus glacialis]
MSCDSNAATLANEADFYDTVSRAAVAKVKGRRGAVALDGGRGDFPPSVTLTRRGDECFLRGRRSHHRSVRPQPRATTPAPMKQQRSHGDPLNDTLSPVRVRAKIKRSILTHLENLTPPVYYACPVNIATPSNTLPFSDPSSLIVESTVGFQKTAGAGEKPQIYRYGARLLSLRQTGRRSRAAVPGERREPRQLAARGADSRECRPRESRKQRNRWGEGGE